MQTKTWVRVGLATVLATAACGGMTMAGCGGDDNSSPPAKEAGADSTNPSEGGGQEGSAAEAGKDAPAETGPTTPNAKVYLVNGVSDPLAPPYRFCFGLGSPTSATGVTVADAIPPYPDTKINAAFPIAGLFSGFGGVVNASGKLAAFNLGSLTISLYAIDATKIANNTAAGGPDGGAEEVCENYIGTDAKGSASTAGGGTLTLGTDYFYAGTIAACGDGGACLAQGQTWLVALTGCAPDEGAGIAPFCGASYNAATGNIGLTNWRLDNTTAVDGGSLGAQFANASQAWDTTVGGASALGAAGTAAGFWSVSTVTVEAGVPEAGDDDGGDGGTTVSDAGPTTETVFGFVPISGPPATAFGDINTPATVIPAALAQYSQTAGFGAAFITADGGTVIFPQPPACNPLLGNCISPLLYPLPIIDAYSGNVTADGGPPNGSVYAGGKTVAFVLLGDPANQLPYIGADGGGSTTPSAVPNGKFAHFLAFPTSNP